MTLHLKSIMAKMMKFPGLQGTILVTCYQVTNSVTVSHILEIMHRHVFNTGDLIWLFH